MVDLTRTHHNAETTAPDLLARAERLSHMGGLGYECSDFIADIRAYLSSLPAVEGREPEWRVLAEQAQQFAISYARDNPKWHGYGREQDPSGVHQWLIDFAALRALASPTSVEPTEAILVSALRTARFYVQQAVDDDGGIDNCAVEERIAIEKVDAALASVPASPAGGVRDAVYLAALVAEPTP